MMQESAFYSHLSWERLIIRNHAVAQQPAARAATRAMNAAKADPISGTRRIRPNAPNQPNAPMLRIRPIQPAQRPHALRPVLGHARTMDLQTNKRLSSAPNSEDDDQLNELQGKTSGPDGSTAQNSEIQLQE